MHIANKLEAAFFAAGEFYLDGFARLQADRAGRTVKDNLLPAQGGQKTIGIGRFEQINTNGINRFYGGQLDIGALPGLGDPLGDHQSPPFRNPNAWDVAHPAHPIFVQWIGCYFRFGWIG